MLILAHALIAQNRQGEAIVLLERAVRRGSDAEIETFWAALCGSRRLADGIEQLRRTAVRRPPYLPAFQEMTPACQSRTTRRKLSRPSKMVLRGPKKHRLESRSGAPAFAGQ